MFEITRQNYLLYIQKFSPFFFSLHLKCGSRGVDEDLRQCAAHDDNGDKWRT